MLFSICLTFFISFFINFTSDILIRNVSLGLAMLILFVIVFLGIIADMVGTAVAAAKEVPFHSMSAKKVKGSAIAINLIRNAEKVSNICNDIVGDIASIISGGTAAVIIAEICKEYKGLDAFWTALTFTSIMAAITVGGKAVGKIIALDRSNDIIFFVAKVFYFATALFKGGTNNGQQKKSVQPSKKNKNTK